MKSKKILPIIFAIIVFFSVSTAALSEKAPTTGKFIENCYVNKTDNTLVIVTSPTLTRGGELKESDLEITLSGEKVPVNEIKLNSDAKIPVTYCCLVDVSGSMNKDQMEQAKGALLAVVNNMAPYDNMAIATLGNTLGDYRFTYDKAELIEIIGALAPGKEDTNLYAGIVQSISTLRTSSDAHLKKCLVLLSDGMDDMVSGYTRDEAVRAITGSNIPIYTVATLRDRSQAESGKSLGEFARLSAGGDQDGNHYVPVIDNISGEEAGRAIASSINSGYVISTDISTLGAPLRDEILLRVRADLNDGSIIEDSITIYAADLPGAKTDPNTGAVVVDTSGRSEEPKDPSSEPGGNGGSGVLLIAIAAAIVIIAIIILLVVFTKKKAAKKAIDVIVDDPSPKDDTNESEEPEQPLVSSDIPKEPTDDITDGITDDITGGFTGEMTEPFDDDMPSGITLKFTMIGSSEKEISFFLPENSEKTIGRNSRADFVLNSEDPQLSGKNSTLLYTNETLYLSDAGSTNGTIHNGIPLRVEKVTVEKDDKIRVGSYEYRINW